MKTLFNIKAWLALPLLISCFYACQKDMTTGKHPNEIGQLNLAGNNVKVDQVNLVADTAGFGASRIDTNLKNAWGIATAPGGPIWIATNHTGLSVIYDKSGNMVRQPVTIPAAVAGQMGAPDGVIFNGTSEFGGNKFIFASEDGIVTGWKSGNTAVKLADRSSSNTVYKGIAMAFGGSSGCFLYLTDFHNGKINVFDNNFNYVTDKPFNDPNIPAGFAPFNVVNIYGQLYVTYAKQKGPDNMDDQAGLGNGYVDIFTPEGMLVKRFASQGTLNSPWGVTWAPAGFADSGPSILVSNFGDGRINIFDMHGNYKGQLQSGGQPVTIDGLWAIDFLKDHANAGDPLYFTAGPDSESHGLFGYLRKK
ncbi:MAG: TIGR03118 family protein [Bacteroidetes bacterium]|nr:TIGR03118 family protein [Bacteroidota bacterium]